MKNIKEIESNSPFQKISANISRLDCDNHGYYYVGYDINNVKFKDVKPLHWPPSNCKNRSLGQVLEVWVSSKNNSYVLGGEPVKVIKYLKSDRYVILFCFPFILAIIIFALRKAEKS